ncbi:MAG: hypothetical protein WC806_00745 [Candidatus Gracilibacteria bacterium]|jgi:hypothetical protein
MENTFLIDLSVKYGLTDDKLSKVADMVYQLGYTDFDEEGAKRAANYICSMNLISRPAEEIVAELKRKGF